MSILDSVKAKIFEEAQKQQSVEMALDADQGFAKREFRLEKGQSATGNILPGKVTWGAAAGAVLGRGCTKEQAEAWVTEQLTAQTKALGFDIDGDVPPWAITQTAFPGHHTEQFVFLGIQGEKGIPNAGRISYRDYPAARLNSLPPEHPRVQATQLPGKYGKNKVQQNVFLNVMEVPTTKSGVDEVELLRMLREGNFIKVMALPMGQYAKLREVRDGIVQMGIPSLTHINLIIKAADKNDLSYIPNTGTPAIWRKPEYMKLVLQEIDRIEPLPERTGLRHLTDAEFETLLNTVKAKNPSGPAA